MKHTDRKSRLFFIEFLIVLFFFLIVSTICLRLFAYARQITDRADALSHAQTAAATTAELLSATDGTAQTLAAYYPDAVIDENILTLMYDRSFRPCSVQEAYYTMTVALSPGASSSNTKMIAPVTEKNAVIRISDREGAELYSLSVSFHTPLTRGEVQK